MRQKSLLFQSMAVVLLLCCAIIATAAAEDDDDLEVKISVLTEHPIIGQPILVKGHAEDGVSPYTYSWNTSDGQINTNKTANFTAPLVAGPFTINLTVNDSSPTPQTVTVTKNITVKDPPPLKAEIDEIEPEHPVVGQEIEAEAKARGGIPPYTFTWNTSDLQNATGKKVTFTAPQVAGPFTINLTVNDSSPMPQTVTVTKNITVKNPPLLKAWIDDIDPDCIAMGKKVEAEADVRGGTPPYNFSWNTSDGQVKYGKEVTFTAPVVAGPFIITLNVTDSGLPTPQTVTDSETVTVKTRCRK